jgi:hypothetical protein
MVSEACPVCSEALPNPPQASDSTVSWFDCPNCGPFHLTDSMLAVLGDPSKTARQRAVLSHAIRRMQRGGEIPTINTYLADQIWREDWLPTVAEQFDNLILYLGGTLSEPGAKMDLHAAQMRAVLGSITAGAAGWVLDTCRTLNLIEGIPIQSFSDPISMLGATLHPAGWVRFQELQHQAVNSRRAFMAMRFGDQELDRVFFEHFKPAVKRAGFDLIKLDEEPRAGLIDDRLRLEIRRSRFLVADLTHGNPGAYWEAGYAEGLGRPVIYTCRQDVFEDPHAKPHFDTNHHLTVVWNAGDAASAAAQLTTTIRVTLPREARLIDD